MAKRIPAVSTDRLPAYIESILFVAEEPVSVPMLIQALRASRDAVEDALAELEQRIASAQCVEPSTGGVVRFGSYVTLQDEAGREQRYQIVGVDEAEPEQGKVAFLSPLARALLGAQVGDSVRLKKPGGTEELAVLAVE